LGNALLEKRYRTVGLAVVAFTSFLQTSFPSKAAMIVPVNCTVTGDAETNGPGQLCNEFIQHLSVTYKGYEFVLGQESGSALALDVAIDQLSEKAISAKLTWRQAGGKAVEGDKISLGVSDHKLTPTMRASLYKQIIQATPIPQ
jgi:hypothetical protein